MKTFKFAILFFISSLAISSCGHNHQSEWSQADKDKWLKTCQETFVDKAENETDKEQLEDLCKCMLDVTSRDYTVEEAVNLTDEQERKLLQNCNYNW
jgi:hypothetical protein